MNFKDDSRFCHGSISLVDPEACDVIIVVDLRSYICTSRAAIATTNFVAVRDMEKGLAGRRMVVASLLRSDRSCMCNDMSHDADMRVAIKY